jgi:hypothetical protein
MLEAVTAVKKQLKAVKAVITVIVVFSVNFCYKPFLTCVRIVALN